MAVNELDYQARAVERAGDEPMEFDVPSAAAGHVVVSNLKYGEDVKDEHRYIVNVEDGEAVWCTCPADEKYPGPCKHRHSVEAEPALLLAAEADR